MAESTNVKGSGSPVTDVPGNAGSTKQAVGPYTHLLSPNDHFVRQTVIALIGGRSCGTGSSVDEGKVKSYIQQAETALRLVKQAEQARQ